MSLHKNVRESKTAVRLMFIAFLLGALGGGFAGHAWHTKAMGEAERAFFGRYLTVSVLQAAGLWGIQNQVGIVSDTQRVVAEFRERWPATTLEWDRLALRILIYLPGAGGVLCALGAGFLVLRKKPERPEPVAAGVKKPWQ